MLAPSQRKANSPVGIQQGPCLPLSFCLNWIYKALCTVPVSSRHAWSFWQILHASIDLLIEILWWHNGANCLCGIWSSRLFSCYDKFLLLSPLDFRCVPLQSQKIPNRMRQNRTGASRRSRLSCGLVGVISEVLINVKPHANKRCII